MKNKALPIILLAGVLYLIYFLVTNFIHPPNNPYKFRNTYLYFSAKWFHSKGITTIISTQQIGKHRNVFNNLDITVAGEKYNDETQPEHENNRPDTNPAIINKGYVDLNYFIALANKSNAKGIYVQGPFQAKGKSIEIMKAFIEDKKGFIYLNSPTEFRELSQPFITFIEKQVKSGSIAVMDFTKTVHTSGSSVLDNLDYYIQYNDSNVDLLIKKLKKQMEYSKQFINEEKRLNNQ